MIADIRRHVVKTLRLNAPLFVLMIIATILAMICFQHYVFWIVLDAAICVLACIIQIYVEGPIIDYHS